MKFADLVTFSKTFKNRRRITDTRLADCDLSVRASGVVAQLGLSTVGQLVRVSGSKLRDTRNCGHGTLQELAGACLRSFVRPLWLNECRLKFKTVATLGYVQLSERLTDDDSGSLRGQLVTLGEIGAEVVKCAEDGKLTVYRSVDGYKEVPHMTKEEA